MSTHDEAHARDLARALGPTEVGRRAAEDRASWAAWSAQVAPLLAAQGYRLAVGEEPGARFAWVKIDDREIDGGLCKLWVVPVG